MRRARLILLGALTAGLIAPGAHAVIPESNLVGNAGAEDGQGATDTSTVAPPPGWASSPTFTAVAYGTSGFPTPEDSAALGGGVNFFAGGNSAVATGTQVVDISAAAAEIDARGVVATLSAQLGGFSSQPDSATVSAAFADAAGASLGEFTVGPVTAADRGGVTGLQPRSGFVGVPAGARTVVVTLTHTRQSGTYNDGYADNVSLVLSAGSAPPPAGGTIGGPTAGPPVRGESVQLRELAGNVTVLVPRSATGRLLRGDEAFAQMSQAGFVPLNQVANIPVGSIVNARRGTARLTAAEGAGPATFREVDVSLGQFQIRQAARGRPITEMRLQGSDFAAACGRSRADARAAGSRRTVNRLRASTGRRRGRFRTRGRFSAATVRGTDWTVTDRCDGTLTRVRRGIVSVRDLARRRTVTLRARQSYLATPRR